MILLTGATGYVGGRLLRRLEREGRPVRCLCRDPEILAGRVASGTQLVPGDLLDRESLEPAFSGVDTAFYLVHSMGSGPEFEAQEKQAAENFVKAAREANVRRIIYLGGLAHGDRLSPHMRSRVETGRILRSSGILTIEFQASIILGSGSASFELIRALVERLPIMITPRWVHTAAQPIAIEDVIDYLMEAIDVQTDISLEVEIAGADITSYLGIMREYARHRALRRWFIAVPFLTPRISSLWLTFVTPVYASIGRALIESVRTPSVVHKQDAARLFRVQPMAIRRAIERAIANEDQTVAETRWSDAARFRTGFKGAEPGPHVLTNEQTKTVPLDADAAFAPVRRIGGRTGWYFGDFLWRLRGLVDLMLGGVGVRRSRPDPEIPLLGTTLDFWRVQVYEPARRLRLFAEMKVPGRAWLEFRTEPDGKNTIIHQTAFFEPRGLGGLLYWYLLLPIHEVMFRGMLRRIAAEALESARRRNAGLLHSP